MRRNSHDPVSLPGALALAALAGLPIAAAGVLLAWISTLIH